MRSVLAIAAAAIAAVLTLGAASSGAASLEDKLKAAIVSKLPQFVEWPAAALAGRATADICVAPPDPLGNDLRELIVGDTVAGRPLSVRRVERDQDVDGCQILFLTAGTLDARRAMLQ